MKTHTWDPHCLLQGASKGFHLLLRVLVFLHSDLLSQEENLPPACRGTIHSLGFVTLLSNIIQAVLSIDKGDGEREGIPTEA